MLDLMEAIKARRSIRKFEPQAVPAEMVQQMLEAARIAPSGSNIQPWRFIVVRDLETRQALRQICSGQKFIEEAPLVFVCYAYLERYSVQARKQRRQEFADAGVLETLSGRFADPKFYARISENQMPREVAVRSALCNTYIAIEHLVLMAAALGLGSCWVGATPSTEKLNELFGLDDNYVAAAVVPVGYPEGKVPSPRPRLSMDEIVIEPKVKLPA